METGEAKRGRTKPDIRPMVRVGRTGDWKARLRLVDVDYDEKVLCW